MLYETHLYVFYKASFLLRLRTFYAVGRGATDKTVSVCAIVCKFGRERK